MESFFLNVNTILGVNVNIKDTFIWTFGLCYSIIMWAAWWLILQVSQLLDPICSLNPHLREKSVVMYKCSKWYLLQCWSFCTSNILAKAKLSFWEQRPEQLWMIVSFLCIRSLYKHYFVLTQHHLGKGCTAYLWKKKKKKLHILYIGYMVSPPQTGARTAITVIALLTGWGALSRQEERKH